MGYKINIVDQSFFMRADNKLAAFEALKKLGTGARHPMAHGGMGTLNPRNGFEIRWFAWLNLAKPEEWRDLEDAMIAWRFPIVVECGSGNVVAISFRGEKLGDEDIMFSTIAPFVQSGSFIKFEGEDGHQWELMFNEGRLLIKGK